MKAHSIPSGIRGYNKKWRKKNKKYIQEWHEHHYKVYKDELLAKGRAYYRKNRKKILAHKKKMRAKKKNKL
ncbi:MAG: hypothetical protein A2W23_03005 [Planctomycetes bacterium RBG_16_43_13]|nr:MAG: hypothetical protein A2W23_03005 [Planctomycetes bacterium RBG_16_43_13]